jgi:transglutaminase-like putative cysteine protease
VFISLERAIPRLFLYLSASFVFLWLMVLAVPAAHAIGFQPVSPDELKMTGEPQAPGAPAIILFREVDRDDNGHTSHEDNYFRIKIFTEEGRKYADVEIPFFRGSGNVVNVKARTIRPDGSIANFDGKVFEKSIVKTKGVKYLAKTFTLPDVQVGSIIEYSYTNDLAENFVFDSHWILSDELFTKQGKFSLKPYTSGFSLFHLKWSWNYLPAGTSPPQEGPDHILRMDAANIPAFHAEDFMPPENELKSRVDFTYSEETPTTDVNEFWKKTGKKLNGELESYIDKRKAMENAVGQIVSPTDSPEVKLQKIYARVQQIRNTSYEVQKSQQEEKREKEKVAGNAEELWKLGYGDGTHLTWLFLALARASGFEAYGVWASDRHNYFFDPKQMDKSKLDTNLVLVKVNGKDVYFDPGAACTPFGLLPWIETGVPGLRMDKDGGSWVQTTLPESYVSRIERKTDLTLSQETGGLEGKLTVTYTGLEALRRRVEEHNEDETNRKKFLEDEIREFIPVGIEVDLTNKPDWNSSAPSLVAEFDLKIPGWASSAGKRALLPIGIFSAPEKHVFDHANREHQIYFEYPSQRVDDVTIELPSGWQATSIPKPRDDEGHIVVFISKAENGGNKLHLTRVLSVDFLLLDPKYYPALRSFFQGIRTSDEEQIVLQPGTATALN